MIIWHFVKNMKSVTAFYRDVENVTPPKTKHPGGAEKQTRPGEYALRTLFGGCMGCGMLLFAFVFLSASALGWVYRF